eukprot:Opistho-1_new@11257
MQALAIERDGCQCALNVGPGERFGHARVFGAEQFFADAAFDVGGEALVEPAIGPHRIGDQIARPGMREFVRDQRDETAVASEEGRRQECEARVFHAAKRKGRRQDQHVITAPAIFAVERFSDLHHALHVGAFVNAALDDAGLGPDAGARADIAMHEIADADGDEIRRDRLRHAEAEGALAVLRALAVRRQHLGAHHRFEAFGHDDARVVGLANAWAVLRRDPSAVVDRLTLAEEKFLAARGLRRLQPLQRARVRAAFVFDLDFPRAVEGDGEWGAKIGAAFAERVRRLAPARADCVDDEAQTIEHDLLRIVARRDGERGLAAHHFAFEIGGQIERHVGDARDLGARVRTGVVRQWRERIARG